MDNNTHREMSTISGCGYAAGWTTDRVVLSFGGRRVEWDEGSYRQNARMAEAFTHCFAQYQCVCRRARVFLRGDAIPGSYGLPFASTRHLDVLAARADWF